MIIVFNQKGEHLHPVFRDRSHKIRDSLKTYLLFYTILLKKKKTWYRHKCGKIMETKKKKKVAVPLPSLLWHPCLSMMPTKDPGRRTSIKQLAKKKQQTSDRKDKQYSWSSAGRPFRIQSFWVYWQLRQWKFAHKTTCLKMALSHFRKVCFCTLCSQWKHQFKVEARQNNTITKLNWT